MNELTSNPRVRVRNDAPLRADGRAVVVWVQRAQRPTDNAALDVAIHAANALGKPVVAFLGLSPYFPNANLRHYRFLVDGVADLAEGLRARGVGLVVRKYPDHHLARFVDEVSACLVVGDENPVREPERWRQKAAAELRVPLWTVDADVVVPTVLLEKEPYAARTARPRIHKHLERFLRHEPEPVAQVPFRAPRGLASLSPKADLLEGLPIDRSVAPVSGFRGGAREGLARLDRFVREGLDGYNEQRNKPSIVGTSQLSPYLHFGHLGPRQVALAVAGSSAPKSDREAFLEQLIVRRELAVGFVRFNPDYDRLEGCETWARRTLFEHQGDPRPVALSDADFEAGRSPDTLWNAGQREMVTTGHMHGYVRMYWAKKILEWSRTPEEAFATAVRLNDRYELDGRDPNGYAGIAWAIGGKHDRAWGPIRPIYGKIRYMSFASTSRKFDLKGYVQRVYAAAR